MIALVGGAGFIGLHVARELQGRGLGVRIVDLCLHGDESRQAAKAILRGVPGTGQAISLYEADATMLDELVVAIRGADLCINLATLCVRETLRDPLNATATIARIGATVPWACVQAKVPRYCYVSSSEVYGEAAAGPLHEGMLCRPQSPYAAAKLVGEGYATAFPPLCYGARGLETVIVRPFNAYGPGAHIYGVAGEAIPRWIAQAQRQEPLTIHGDGLQTRDFTYVEDIARGIVDAALSDAAVNTGPVNLCSGVERTMFEVAQAVSMAHKAEDRSANVLVPDLKVSTAPRPCELRRQVGNASRARTILGWEPRVRWAEGLARTVEDVRRRNADWIPPRPEIPEKPWT